MKLLLLLSISIISTVYATNYMPEEKPSIWSQSYASEADTNYEKAISLIKPLTNDKDTAELANLRLGWLSYLNGNHGGSFRYYGKSLKDNPNSIDAHLGMTLPLLAQKRYRAAVKHTQMALKLSPNNYSASAKMMQILTLQKKWSSLNEYATNVSSYYPNLIEPLVYIARSNLYLGEQDDAKKYYKKVLRLMPSHNESKSVLRQLAE